ncbi:hypothetical protein CLV49_0437 [Labedella gwakjiensis]|uniref:DUF4232 domain-containing protein n=1 Tax=Labedella gwakjiensis TaxID=390269 RepID=A0A2P8GS97_9MICO|nr:hypothetical protein [Labedella gwakjiensis]PSL36838.1 hypothetical protein CLV49_0437 [Labedella gwakjiensis]RUQ84342.1 hypothetical protein ELQ93_16165 [Labedella gwakjiensis]
MSTNERPERPSKAVYRRRRLVVLLGLLAIIAVIALLIIQPGSSSGRSQEPSASPSASAGTSDAAVTPSPSATASDGDPACTADTVTVEAKTDKSTYQAGELPQLSLSLTNTGSVPCTIDVGTSQQVFTITSGQETYWTSTDCQTEPTNAVTLLEPQTTITSNPAIAWDRTRSATDTCEGERPAVPAGGASYHLNTTVAGIESEDSAQFLLY